MSYINVYSSRINWENEPSITSPINATNLNKMDYALYEMDGTFANWDTTKANESDMLLAIKSVDYDTETGVFLFTWFNGTTKTVDLNIEKIPVSFSMSPQGVITMKTEDGTEYTADVGSLIKTYTFNDSSEIDFTVTTDASGNKTVTASLVAGSIDGTKLTPNYLADCTAAKTAAEGAANSADDSAEDAEAWAVGERGGIPVPSTDPTYHNNSKYWSEQANPTTLTGLTDTDINNPTDGQNLQYDAATSKWVNGAGGGGGSLATLSDVDISPPITNMSFLAYDSGTAKWVSAIFTIVHTLQGATPTTPVYGSGYLEYTRLFGQGTTYSTYIPVAGMGSWTSAVSGSIGDTTVTFTDAAIKTTSTLDLYCENTSGTPVSYTSVSVSTGSAVFTIPALTEATTFKLWVRDI